MRAFVAKIAISFLLLALAAAMALIPPFAIFPYTKFVLGGMFCSFVGDVLLGMPGMPDKAGAKLKLAGGVAFAAAHIFYAIAFASMILALAWPLAPSISAYFVLFIIILFIAGKLSRDNVKRRVLMFLYAVMLLIPVSLSFGLIGLSLLPFIGMLLFLISDILIGVDAGYKKIPHAGLWILSTYFPAQALIILGFAPIMLAA